jgi:hypothetical protein
LRIPINGYHFDLIETGWCPTFTGKVSVLKVFEIKIKRKLFGNFGEFWPRDLTALSDQSSNKNPLREGHLGSLERA